MQHPQHGHLSAKRHDAEHEPPRESPQAKRHACCQRHQWKVGTQARTTHGSGEWSVDLSGLPTTIQPPATCTPPEVRIAYT